MPILKDPPAQVERTVTGYHIWTRFSQNGKLRTACLLATRQRPCVETKQMRLTREMEKEVPLKKEKSIEQKRFSYRTLLLKVVPIVLFLLFILAIPWIWYFVSTRTRRIAKGAHYTNHHRILLFVLAKALYQL